MKKIISNISIYKIFLLLVSLFIIMFPYKTLGRDCGIPVFESYQVLQCNTDGTADLEIIFRASGGAYGYFDNLKLYYKADYNGTIFHNMWGDTVSSVPLPSSWENLNSNDNCYVDPRAPYSISCVAENVGYHAVRANHVPINNVTLTSGVNTVCVPDSSPDIREDLRCVTTNNQAGRWAFIPINQNFGNNDFSINIITSGIDCFYNSGYCREDQCSSVNSNIIPLNISCPISSPTPSCTDPYSWGSVSTSSASLGSGSDNGNPTVNLTEGQEYYIYCDFGDKTASRISVNASGSSMTPTQVGWFNNGNIAQFRAIASNTGGTYSNTCVYSGNPANNICAKQLTVNNISITSPIKGYLDEAKCSFRGWTCDQDHSSDSISVHFYLDGPSGSNAKGVNAGVTNIDRNDVNNNTDSNGNIICKEGTPHGFNYPVPQDWIDGKSHTVYAYGVNGNKYSLLNNAPMTINCKSKFFPFSSQATSYFPVLNTSK